MTIGISKERLEELLEETPIHYLQENSYLIKLAIPRGLATGNRKLKGHWSNYPRSLHLSNWQTGDGVILHPTHYQELPEDPKE